VSRVHTLSAQRDTNITQHVTVVDCCVVYEEKRRAVPQRNERDQRPKTSNAGRSNVHDGKHAAILYFIIAYVPAESLKRHVLHRVSSQCSVARGCRPICLYIAVATTSKLDVIKKLVIVRPKFCLITILINLLIKSPKMLKNSIGLQFYCFSHLELCTVYSHATKPGGRRSPFFCLP